MYFDHSTLGHLENDRRSSSAHNLEPLDADAALELKRLQAAVREIGELATQAQQAQGAVVTVAWLRRLTREVDRLQACWLNSLQEPPPRRRRDDMEPAPQWR
ncbi:MAG TPA: hypothetical protein VJO99_23185 [Burkholderiaceae bacterium]|nr:hypothetical protein [Burkholderiaceae bacterium]